MGYIYSLKNKITNEMYVGQTTRTPKIRLSEHIKESRKERAINRKLYIAINKYGIDSFLLNVLEECSNKLLDEKEEYYINLYNTKENGYNETYGGKGKPFVNETLEKEIINFYLNNVVTLEELGNSYNLSSDTVKSILDKNDIEINRVSTKRDFKIKMVNTTQELVFSNIDECVNWIKINKNINTDRISDSILRVIDGKRKTYLKYKFFKIE